MPNNLDGLAALLPLPDRPSNATNAWDGIEAAIEFSLPRDYKAYISTYGSGQLSCGLYVYNYSLAVDRERVSRDLNALAAILEADKRTVLEITVSLGSSARPLRPPIPFPVFPEAGGLLLWGYCPEGWRFYWVTSGDADTWSVLVTRQWNDEYYHIPEVTLVPFLIELFRNPFHEELRCQGKFYPFPAVEEPQN